MGFYGEEDGTVLAHVVCVHISLWMHCSALYHEQYFKGYRLPCASNQ